MALRQIVLHGSLAERFAPGYKLAVDSPADVIRALGAMVPGFAEELLNGDWVCVAGPDTTSYEQGRDMTVEELHLPWRDRETVFHIVPAVRGAGKGGVKIIVGVAIMALAVASAVMTGGGSLAALAGTNFLEAFGGSTVLGFTISSGSVFMIGAMAALGGIAMMIAPQPKSSVTSTQDQKASYLFNNVVNSTSQGGPIPLIYGKCMVGSVVVGMTVDPIDIAASTGVPSNPALFHWS